MTQISDARRRVVRAIQQLIKAEIAARDDSLGSYQEEKELDEALENYEWVMRETNIGALE